MRKQRRCARAYAHRVCLVLVLAWRGPSGCVRLEQVCGFRVAGLDAAVGHSLNSWLDAAASAVVECVAPGCLWGAGPGRRGCRANARACHVGVQWSRVMLLINLAHVASRWNLGCGVDSIMLAGKCKRLIELCVPGDGWQQHTAHPQEGGIRKASGAGGLAYACTPAA